jgi:hypothetical protein
MTVFCFGECTRARPSTSAQLLARAKVSVCTTVGLAPCTDAHDHRALPCPAPCRARARVAPNRSAGAEQLR